MVKKQLFYLFYIFCSFTLIVWGGKNILPNLTNSQEQEPVFLPLGAVAGADRKKIPGTGAALEKSPEPEPLEKKVKSRSR